MPKACFTTRAEKAALKKSLDEALFEATDTARDLQGSAHGAVLGITNATETVYLNASGKTSVNEGKDVVPQAKMALFSCTKAVTTTALLILVTQGRITLDDPISKFYPEFGDIKVIEGDKEPRASKTAVTLRHLLTHTSGFTYECLFSLLGSVAEEEGEDQNKQALEDSYLSFEPGTCFSYGIGIDWAGFILEHITGLSLGEYMKQYIFDPLDMHDTAFVRDKKEENLLMIHSRRKDGSLVISKLAHSYRAPRHMGGQGLFGTVEDYLKFLRLWLNEGCTPAGRRLFSKDLYDQAIQNQLPEGVELSFESAFHPEFSRPIPNAPFGIVDSWGLGFARTEGNSPTGRPKGTLYWCGVANLFYWIDIENKIAGLYATQILPMLDDSASHFLKIEKRVYDQLLRVKL